VPEAEPTRELLRETLGALTSVSNKLGEVSAGLTKVTDDSAATRKAAYESKEAVREVRADLSSHNAAVTARLDALEKAIRERTEAEKEQRSWWRAKVDAVVGAVVANPLKFLAAQVATAALITGALTWQDVVCSFYPTAATCKPTLEAPAPEVRDAE
jgi:hypothetical protein